MAGIDTRPSRLYSSAVSLVRQAIQDETRKKQKLLKKYESQKAHGHVTERAAKIKVCRVSFRKLRELVESLRVLDKQNDSLQVVPKRGPIHHVSGVWSRFPFPRISCLHNAKPGLMNLFRVIEISLPSRMKLRKVAVR